MTFLTAIIIGASVVTLVIVLLHDRPWIEPEAEVIQVGARTNMYDGYFKRLREDYEAWAFWSWANAIYLADLEANPPAEKFRLDRTHQGRWIVQVYDGAREYDWVTSFRQVGGGPPSKPCGEHHFRTIGEPEGFLYRKDAEKFLVAYAADDGSAVALDANAWPIKALA